MNRLMLVLLLTLADPASAQFGESVVKELTFDEYEPIVLSVDLGLDANESAETWWRVTGSPKYRKVSPTEIAVWAPPGQHAIWLGAAITKVTKTTIETTSGPQEVVTGFSTRRAEFDYLITVRGKRPPPVVVPIPDDKDDTKDDTEDVTDDDVTVSGDTFCVIVRNTEDVTESSGLRQAIFDLHEYADSTDDVYVIEVDADAESGIAKTYASKVPSGAKMPYYFVSRKDSGTGKAHIFHSGELGKSADALKQIKEARDAS